MTACAIEKGIGDPVHIIGASGRSGAALCRALLAAGAACIPLVRSRAKWEATGIGAAACIADIADTAALRAALADARLIVSTAHARYAPLILEAAPASARFVFLGSTRKFTRWPDEHARGVLVGEAAFLASGRTGVMLHPTMIYGAQGEDNVQRLAALLRRLPFIPLPGGGKALVQPIHQSDVTRAIAAALAISWSGPNSVTIAGPVPLPYADLVRAVAKAASLHPPRILPLPAAPLMGAAALTRLLPVLPTVHPAEIRRLLEDKAFDIEPMRRTLGIDPMPLGEGLARTFHPEPTEGSDH
jgi:nucleoside-diphosphate-sugar epimerase